MGERNLAIRVMLLPKDTNAHGTIFGGVILSQIDLAGAVEARKVSRHKVVTVAMNAVEFHQPVYVGDVVSFYTTCTRTGRTSLQIHVEVEALRSSDGRSVVKVTEADVIYVTVDDAGNKVPVAS
jgi:acyl-CoA thioesterase YciA